MSDAPTSPTTQHTGAPPDESLYIGRDLAWLDFNSRVLAQAQSADRPAFDRIRFLAISESNLDEFFMKRVALLRRRIELGLDKTTHDGLSVRQQLEAARQRVRDQQQHQAAAWSDGIRPALDREGVRITAIEDLPPRYQARVDDWFERKVFPLLTPLAVDPGHPFPFVSNLSRNFGVLLAEPGEDEPRFARVKIPDAVPSWVRVPRHGMVGEIQDTTPCRVVRAAEIVRRNLESIFPGMRILDVLEFRVTRAVGLEESDDDDVDDLAEWVRASLRHRRFAEAVRLETSPDPSPRILQLLLEELELMPEAHYERVGPLELGGLMDLTRFDRPDLATPRWRPVVPPALADREEPIFDAIARGDVLVNHPFDSFRGSVERFIAEAADDPDVLAIKQCLYRTEPDSPFIHSLLRAAEAGKQVTCLVELRARFDEDRNLQLTRTLEKHGVHVAYGVVGLKTHAKCSLVIRRETGGFRAYAHIGTGNYHPVTADSYCDCGLLTCREEITGDLIQVFNFLTGRSRHTGFEKLLVAPINMRDRFLSLIDGEIEAHRAGRPARIIAKMNQLEDTRMMQALIRASRAGVPCDILVRGFCCLKSGVPDYTENLRIRSIIGDFLEHSRIYHFARGSHDALQGEWFIGSADWMDRNLSQRVEVVTPVEHEEGRRRLARIFDVQLADGRDAWVQTRGEWSMARPAPDTLEDDAAQLGTFDTLRRDALSAEVEALSRFGARSTQLRTLPTPDRTPESDEPLVGVERILGLALVEAPWRSAGEVRRRLGLSPSLATTTAKRLERAGLIERHKCGPNWVWIPTPGLAEAVGGPLTLVHKDGNPVVSWLAYRVAHWLNAAGRSLQRVSGAIDLLDHSDERGWTAWCLLDDRRGLKDRLESVMDRQVDRVVLIGLKSSIVESLRSKVRKMDADQRRRVTVLSVKAAISRTTMDAES